MYDKKDLELGRIYDDANSLKQYNAQILALVRKEYTKRNIDFYGYERFVNILQCMSLQIDGMKDRLNVIVDKPTKTGTTIDLVG